MPPTSEEVCFKYLRHREKKARVKEKLQLLIRPITADDATLCAQFFDCLSEETTFLRFLRYRKSLPDEWIHRFTHVDHSRDVAMIAVEETDFGERIVGECRIVRSTGSTRGEVALVVADAWQRKGVGSALLEQSTRIAKELGMRSLWALVSSENAKAVAMAGKFGFSITGNFEADTLELEKNLD